MTVSIEDVAARAGVSTATVSRALRGLPNVSSRTRQRVQDAARALDYVVSPSASSLATGRTSTVGVGGVPEDAGALQPVGPEQPGAVERAEPGRALPPRARHQPDQAGKQLRVLVHLPESLDQVREPAIEPVDETIDLGFTLRGEQ